MQLSQEPFTKYVLFSFNFLSGKLALREGDVLTHLGPANLPSNETKEVCVPPQTKTLDFDKIKKLYETYRKKRAPDVRLQIINGLNILMQRNLLTSDQAKKAETIAKCLKDPNLLVRLQTIRPDYEKRLGKFNTLPSELMRVILDKVIEGQAPHKILQLLTVSKGFNKELLTAPVSLDLSPYKNKVTEGVISTLVSIFPNLKVLNLADCNKITDAGLEYLAFLTPLY